MSALRSLTSSLNSPFASLRSTGRRAWALSATPVFYRRSAALAVAALAVGIVSGGAVRLTGSGLGCRDWPGCTVTSIVAPLQYHAWIEFGNRLVNVLITIGVVLVAIAALRRRPRRRDLVALVRRPCRRYLRRSGPRRGDRAPQVGAHVRDGSLPARHGAPCERGRALPQGAPARRRRRPAKRPGAKGSATLLPARRLVRPSTW